MKYHRLGNTGLDVGEIGIDYGSFSKDGIKIMKTFPAERKPSS